MIRQPSAWVNGGAGWVANEATYDRAFAPVTDAILQLADLRVGQSLLDVGCGSGTLLAAAASRPQAAIEVADAEAAELATSAPYDRVVSRFGVMFFDDPTAAFTNIRRATAPNGRLTFACWRSLAENPSFTNGSSILTSRMADAADTSALTPDPTAPGPMALADADRLLGLLTDAGWRDIMIIPFDFTLDYGAGRDGVEARLAVILATGWGARAERLLRPEVGESRWAGLVAQVRSHLHDQLVDGRVQLPGATWLVTAANSAIS
ncbi:MAG: class I SAM-dependent methyltransferase [Propionibacteriales bacterium]|nr:class I SAM-dependent methyltransferase [Propionibacteriales bacterium]